MGARNLGQFHAIYYSYLGLIWIHNHTHYRGESRKKDCATTVVTSAPAASGSTITQVSQHMADEADALLLVQGYFHHHLVPPRSSGLFRWRAIIQDNSVAFALARGCLPFGPTYSYCFGFCRICTCFCVATLELCLEWLTFEHAAEITRLLLCREGTRVVGAPAFERFQTCRGSQRTPGVLEIAIHVAIATIEPCYRMWV